MWWWGGRGWPCARRSYRKARPRQATPGHAFSRCAAIASRDASADPPPLHAPAPPPTPLGGPTIKWRAGRKDATADKCTPDGRLPDATLGAGHLLYIFGRMGFTPAEIVALSGAHTLGRCHADRSGFVGPWTRAPTTVSNQVRAARGRARAGGGA